VPSVLIWQLHGGILFLGWEMWIRRLFLLGKPLEQMKMRRECHLWAERGSS